MKLIREEFYSIEELLKILRNKENNKVMRDEHSSQKSDYSFTKTHSYKEAEELITNGYVEILDQIKAGIKFKTTENSKVIPEDNVFGYVPNVPNAIMNLPKSMIYQKRAPRKITTIDLIYFFTGSCSVESDEFIKTGIKLLNIINSLEKNNIRVKLSTTVYAGKTDKELAVSYVNLKSYREKLNLQKICFPIAHPSLFRRFGFKWLETTEQIGDRGWTYGYGRPPKRQDLEDSNFFTDKNRKALIFNEIKDLSEEQIIAKYLN